MNAFKESIVQVSKGALKAFQRYPASVASALAFSIVTMVRIQLDWPEQEAYNFLFNCLHWSFAVGAVFSLATITAAHSRFNTKKAFLTANLLGAGAVLVTFLLLYWFGETAISDASYRYMSISNLALSRVTAFIFICIVSFMIIIAKHSDRLDFAKSFFMTHKALFIALIYGSVIMSGVSGVAGAFQALLYRDMSVKVYEYIGTLVGFLSFTIFVGFFPDFKKGEADPRIEETSKQPRFIEVLFGNIMVPIALALTAVLLLWTIRSVFSRETIPFVRLSAIATSYATLGIWLHIMLTHHKSRLSEFYKMVFPYTALVILAFEARALIIQLSAFGLKPTEYSFILIWIFAVSAALLLIIKKSKSHITLALTTCVLACVAVLPIIGYHALPVSMQVRRLENILTEQGILSDNELTPAQSEPELKVRESITESVMYLAYAQDAKLPDWFDRDLGENNIFKSKLGFEQVMPRFDEEYYGGKYLSLRLPSEAVDITGFRWAFSLENFEGKDATASSVVNGDNGKYFVQWSINTTSGIPKLIIEKDDQVILEDDMNTYIDRIAEKFPPGESREENVTLEDMTYLIETPEITVLLVFNNIEINSDNQNDKINYWINMNTLYMKEN
ncbi:MAG: DUF4153 domain-containing protein [Clostridia bacterium]|nr:DUF4153 domain-containing protein [Clostridia bacterium]